MAQTPPPAVSQVSANGWEHGLAARYHFLSDFVITSSRDAVWTALIAVEEWPTWWRWLKRIDVIREATSENGVGAVYRNHVSSPTGYGFVFEGETAEVERLCRIDLMLSGEIVGRVRYLVSDDPSGGTNVSYAQLVETPKWWMNLLAPIARPGFTWNHDKLMTDFGRGLAKASGGELVRVRNWTLKPGAPGFYEMPALEGLTSDGGDPGSPSAGAPPPPMTPG